MMNDLDVIIYSYKGKYVKEVIKNVKEYSSNIFLIDQHPIDRKEIFRDDVTEYRHVFWDWQISPCFHKKEYIYKSKSKYLLILSDNIILNKNWYHEFISFIKDNIVLSGAGKLKLVNNKFFLNKEITDSSEYSLTNFINRDFIFCNKDVFDKVEYPEFIKYNGEEEVLSLMMYGSGYSIHSVPSNLISNIGDKNLESIYVPFSKNHKYNSALNFIKMGRCQELKTEIDQKILNNFHLFHEGKINNIKPLPFIDDDVLYNPNSLNFLKVNGRKFTEKTRAIH